MTNKIARWGNSLALRIPRNLAAELGFEDGTPVSVEKRHGSIIVKPRRRRRTLADLCKGLTPAKTGGEVDTGRPVGKEAW